MPISTPNWGSGRAAPRRLEGGEGRHRGGASGVEVDTVGAGLAESTLTLTMSATASSTPSSGRRGLVEPVERQQLGQFNAGPSGRQ